MQKRKTMIDYIPCKGWTGLWIVLGVQIGLALSILVVPWLVDTINAAWKNRAKTKVPHGGSDDI